VFANDAAFASSPYRWPVPLDAFRQSAQAIEDRAAEVMNQNVSSLAQLCGEFGFRSLSSKLSAFRSSRSCTDSADAEARSRISGLEERVWRPERRLASLETKLSPLAQTGAL
jgi:hypothetical protein